MSASFSFEHLAALSAWLALPAAALAAVLVDRGLGEPRRWHPLVGFGRLAHALEAALRRPQAMPLMQRLAGVLAWSLAVLPLAGGVAWLRAMLGAADGPLNGAAAGWRLLAPWLLDVTCLYLALGACSLREHVLRVANDLARGDLSAARTHVGWIVSRDTRALDEAGVARAAVETTLENGNDAIFGALFWFALLGGPGALLFRLANTLDAMWGYRNERFRWFGWAAARLDDALNYLPARLTAFSYALAGRAAVAWACWRTQAKHWDSPNAGPVMAAGAGALGVRLGGSAIYHGREEVRPALGDGMPPTGTDIVRAMTLVERALAGWLAAGFVLAICGIWLAGLLDGGPHA